jgi:hypothetical protein
MVKSFEFNIAYREVSHPNLIDITPITAKGYPDCSNIAELSAISQKPSKSLIWISAKDKSKKLICLNY